MRLLILGADGMLGHRMYQHLGAAHEVWASVRRPDGADLPLAAARLASGLDVREFEQVETLLDRIEPAAVVNCVGVVKQRPDAENPLVSIAVNSLFPHRLADACVTRGIRLLHFSTDCVFSGRRGAYTEEDVPDPVDLYGRSKLLGEMNLPGCLVLRTSIVGPELHRRQGLLEWLRSASGEVRGFRNAIFSGLSTLEASRVVAMLLESRPDAHGIYHLSSEPVNKCELLEMLVEAFDLPTRVVPADEPRLDRSLDSTRFRSAFDYSPPSWRAMARELASEMKAPPPSGHAGN